jgi:hypothetical protein
MIANAWFLDCTEKFKRQYSAVTLSVIFLILNIVKKIKCPEAASRAKCFVLVSYLAYSLTLNVEATCSSRILVDFQQTLWHYILTTVERTAGSISLLIMSSDSYQTCKATLNNTVVAKYVDHSFEM